MLICRTLLAAVLLSFLAFATVSCDREGPAEKTGEKIDKTVEKTGDKMKEMSESREEKAKDAEVEKKTP